MDLRHRSWHELDIAETAAALSVDPSRGLDAEDVERRRELAGPNILPEASRRSSIRAFLEQFQSPLIYILFIAAIFAFALDRYGDSIVILVVVFINAILGWFQERRAERSMEALRQLSVLRAMVVREGEEKDIEVSELVPGDIILLAAGDGVGADARLLEVTVLEAAEATLTGESMPVAKHARALPLETLLADRANMVYSGTYITSGRCRALVVGTGQDTEVGKIARMTGGGNAKDPTRTIHCPVRTLPGSRRSRPVCGGDDLRPVAWHQHRGDLHGGHQSNGLHGARRPAGRNDYRLVRWHATHGEGGCNRAPPGCGGDAGINQRYLF
jgi:magnesium-transporting ATPase (P-type)